MAGRTQADFLSGTQPVPTDPRIEPEQRPRLNRQCQAILARLQQGPATNMELLPISTRFSARIHELRKHGYRIEITDSDRARGLNTYALKDSAPC